MPLSECNRTVLDYNKTPNLVAFRNGVSDGQYCAHDEKGIFDSCQGPLQIFPDGSDTAEVVGIVSFGIGCGSIWPGIYTRVARYLEWIESHVWPNGIDTNLVVSLSNS